MLILICAPCINIITSRPSQVAMENTNVALHHLTSGPGRVVGVGKVTPDATARTDLVVRLVRLLYLKRFLMRRALK
jgi:hypothetical protein